MRKRVQIELIHTMVRSAQELGATSVLSLVPNVGAPLVKRTGLNWDPIGPVMPIDGIDCVCVNLSLAPKMH